MTEDEKIFCEVVRQEQNRVVKEMFLEALYDIKKSNGVFISLEEAREKRNYDKFKN